MAISRFAASRLTQGLPKYQSAWDIDNVAPGVLEPIATIRQSVFDNFGFYNIPSTYRHLYISGSVTGQAVGSGSDWLGCFFNSDATTSNYSTTRMYSDATTPLSNRTTSGSGSAIMSSIKPTNSGSTYGHFEAFVIDYSETNKFKTILTKFSADSGTGGSGNNSGKTIGLWRNTAAIHTIWFTGTNNYPGPDSMITIYGIKG